MSPQRTQHAPRAAAASLADIALQLFDQHGYDGVTVSQIAKSAGVTQRTFFRHFATKVDVLLADSHVRQQYFVEALHRQPAKLTLLQALQGAITEDEKANPWTDRDATLASVVRNSTTLSNTRRNYETWFESIFAAWIADRLSKSESDLDVRLTAAALVAIRRVVVDEWLLVGPNTPVANITSQAFTNLTLILD